MGIDILKLKVGDRVHYQPEHYIKEDKWENGMVKEIREGKTDGVWVVYNCAGNWGRYRDYTGCLTSLKDLKLGWKHPCEWDQDDEDSDLYNTSCGEIFELTPCGETPESFSFRYCCFCGKKLKQILFDTNQNKE